MTVISYTQRLQGDIENICEMAKDDIDAALWHWSRNPTLSAENLESAIANAGIALELIRANIKPEDNAPRDLGYVP